MTEPGLQFIWQNNLFSKQNANYSGKRLVTSINKDKRNDFISFIIKLSFLVVVTVTKIKENRIN